MSSSGANGRPANLWIRGILALLLTTGLVALLMEASTLNFHPKLRRVAHRTPSEHSNNSQQLVQKKMPEQATGSSNGDATTNATVTTDELLLEMDPKDQVSPADLYHLSLLHGACIAHKDAIVTWKFGAPGDNQSDEEHNLATLIHEDDPDLLQKLRQCPDVDLFLPSGVRNNGYCEDTMAYTKYLNTRLLPLWALTKEIYDPELNRKVDYFDLCPKTAMLFFQHYWEDIPSSPRWPKDKKMYLMPNIEMWELDETHFWRVDVVLCKTRICEDRLNRWYEQEGNPRGTKIIYTKHTSSDQASYARRVLGDEVKPKDFSDVRFIHTWAYDGMFKGGYEKRIPKSQIRLNTDQVDAREFDKAIAETSYFLCPSQMEGYGHYMNQARASGGVIITTDMEPMKELIPSDDMGLKVPTKFGNDRNMFLGGRSKKRHGLKGVPGMVAVFNSRDLCKTVDHLLNDFSVDQRREMGSNARRQYHKDTKFFEQAMLDLRVLARQQAGSTGQNDTTGDISTASTGSDETKHLHDGPS
ncbi:hypothetical protein BBJ29_003377 [Phytophthora kernoviae]|uniref:Glycosyl transferase family 1 domain-containing protein n=1 Tax=Phytophthora kernoviae TaxID=325452 RepID=A0A3F2RMM4_9STRA|nr:hypothetical protein BBP00_00006127 [Phytophthora kernoviae]RLN67509.1 hypothetical protein BBJ29_003377 [Phytophthora kernoviae]